MTQMLTKTAAKVNSDARVSGAAYQVDGQTYNASEIQDRTPCITMLALFIDESIDGGAGLLLREEEKSKNAREARSIYNIIE